MKRCIFLAAVIFFQQSVIAQNITYSEAIKGDSRDMNFEILGNFGGNFLVYKNIFKRQEITVYANDLSIKETINLDFISDRTSNIDFISYPDYFIAIWQYEKGNITHCEGAKISGTGKLIGQVAALDTTKTGTFSAKVTYATVFSDDKNQILVYKVISKNNRYELVTKVYDPNLALEESTKKIITYNDNKEYFNDLLVANDGTVAFTKVRETSGSAHLGQLELNVKKFRTDSLVTINIPLDDRVIEDPYLRIDNAGGRFILSSFVYKNNNTNIEGLFNATVSRDPLQLQEKYITVLDDSLFRKMSGRPERRSAFDNLAIRNIILKKDGGFIAVTEEYFKQRRYGSAYDDRYFPYNYGYRYGTASDYDLFNRGYYGYYRPYNDIYSRDVVYNYNDIINLSFTKTLRLQWTAVINKTTSDLENDNFLSFANMNAGNELRFLFLQNDNNRQIVSDHALQPDGTIIRNATLKGREQGYEFMPRLGRQTGRDQMIIPCVVRNNIAFAKIDF